MDNLIFSKFLNFPQFGKGHIGKFGKEAGILKKNFLLHVGTYFCRPGKMFQNRKNACQTLYQGQEVKIKNRENRIERHSVMSFLLIQIHSENLSFQ